MCQFFGQKLSESDQNLDLNHIGYLTGPEVSTVAPEVVEIGHKILFIKGHGEMWHIFNPISKKK